MHLNNSNEIVRESSIFPIEQILHSDFTIRFYTLSSNFAIADFEQLDSCCFLKSQLHSCNHVHVQFQETKVK